MIFEQQMIGRLVSQWASRENRLVRLGNRQNMHPDRSAPADAKQLPSDSTNLAALFRSLYFGLSLFTIREALPTRGLPMAAAAVGAVRGGVHTRAQTPKGEEGRRERKEWTDARKASNRENEFLSIGLCAFGGMRGIVCRNKE